MGCQLPTASVSIHHQTSSACQSTTTVSGTILASLGRDSLPMTISVALLTNTTHFCMDHHQLTLHFLGRSNKMSIPLDSVPLGKTTVIGMVSVAQMSEYLVLHVVQSGVAVSKISKQRSSYWAAIKFTTVTTDLLTC